MHALFAAGAAKLRPYPITKASRFRSIADREPWVNSNGAGHLDGSMMAASNGMRGGCSDASAGERTDEQVEIASERYKNSESCGCLVFGRSFHAQLGALGEP